LFLNLISSDVYGLKLSTAHRSQKSTLTQHNCSIYQFK